MGNYSPNMVCIAIRSTEEPPSSFDPRHPPPPFSLTHRPTFALRCMLINHFRWSIAFIIAAAIPDYFGFVSVIASATLLEFTYCFPPMLALAYDIQLNAISSDEGFDPQSGTKWSGHTSRQGPQAMDQRFLAWEMVAEYLAFSLYHRGLGYSRSRALCCYQRYARRISD